VLVILRQRRNSVAEISPLGPLTSKSAEDERSQESASPNGPAPGLALACQYSAFGHLLLNF